MRIQKSFVALILGMALAASSSFVFASNKPLAFDAVRSQQAEIRTGVETRSGRYKDLSVGTRGELLSKQAQMLRVIEGKQSSAELSESQATEVFNTLEWIEAVVNKAEDERMVCERRTVLGSNRKERVCKTAAQIRIEREAARDQVDSRGICADCKGG